MLGLARIAVAVPGGRVPLRPEQRPEPEPLAAEGLRLLAAGESDLHCGGVDRGLRLPDFLRPERFLDMTAGIVAVSVHPLLDREVTEEDLAACPWVDFDAAAPPRGDAEVSLATLLDRLHETTHRRVPAIIRSGSAGLSVMAGSTYLASLSLTFLERLPGALLRPVSVEFGRYTYRLLAITEKRGYLIILEGPPPTTCSVEHLGLRRVKPLRGSCAALRPFG